MGLQLCEVRSFELLLLMMVPPFLVLFATVSVFAVPEDKDLVQYGDYDYADRIIGGVPAAIEEFPFFVSVLYVLKLNINAQITSGCGGTIITEHWVLTASHCVNLDVSSDGVLVVERGIIVRAGSSFMFRGGTTRPATMTVSHNHPHHDIALIKVHKPWRINGFTISRARLPPRGDPIPVYRKATIMGWGGTDLKETPPDILTKLEVVVISPTFCNVTWLFWIRNATPLTDAHICTLHDPMKKPSSAFKGDSGGPLVVDGEVVGIVSRGANTTGIVPNLYVRVSSYIDWIETIVGPLRSAK